MSLVIAEKPELARAIVEALGGGIRKGGYYDCGEHLVTNCIGHMLELLEPEDYDKRYEKWTMGDLPWVAVPWRKRPIDKTKDQLKIVLDLLRNAKSVIHAGDPDDEGQLIVDEILDYAKFKGPVQRLLINDNNPQIVRRQIGKMEDNNSPARRGQSAAAEARAVGDLLYGVNITRAYSLAAQQKGYQGVLHVGRVQTPITGMVVRRCREFAAHSSTFYYNVCGLFSIGGQDFPARYQTIESDPVDDKRRLIDKARATAIANAINGKPARIVSSETMHKTTHPPLPYNLLKLQAAASRKFGYKPDETLAITQSLRDNHKLITYNRSDSQYLSDEHHADAPNVLAAVAATAAPALTMAAQKANPQLKSRAFDSKKVSAHHGIIPTATTAALSALTEQEQKIYLLIARAYVAQFWPKYEYDQTTVFIEAEGYRFGVRSNVQTAPGWTLLFRNDDGNEDLEADPDDLTVDLRKVSTGQEGVCNKGEFEENKTKPTPLYTMATLLMDLCRVAKYVKDDRLRKLLIEKDKDKEGEHGGIGTPATRHAILKGLFEKGYLIESGKNVIATKKGEELYDALPDQARFPDMTAIWHEQQLAIAAGDGDAVTFINSLMQDISAEVERVKTEGIAIKVLTVPCPKCAKPMRRVTLPDIKVFWACVDREVCKNTMNDKDGKPVAREAVVVSTLHKCMSCGKGLIARAGTRKPGSKAVSAPWWSCSGYPDCKQSYPDIAGKPDYSKPKDK